MAPKQKDPVYVLGVGMTKFIKPRGKVDYTELGFEAGVKAMLDAQVNYDDIDMGVTQVLRGEDHVSNTAVQIQIFTALFAAGFAAGEGAAGAGADDSFNT